MSRVQQLKESYSSICGFEAVGVGAEVIVEVEFQLGLRLPVDFTEIARFYSGDLLGSIEHHAISVSGSANTIVAETLRLRKAVGLPTRFVVMAEPPESLIVMDALSSEVIWCDAFDVHNLATGNKLHKPQVWRSYSEFFEHLLGEEKDERLGN